MYCSIQDAWQDNEFTYKTKIQEQNRPNQIKEEYNNDLMSNECINFLNHIQGCKKCRNEIMGIVAKENIMSFNPQIKEVMIIFLIGIIILMILNLLYK